MVKLTRDAGMIPTGGITQMKKMATLAEAFYVPLAPHCTMSELGLSASLHLAASIPLFLIHEQVRESENLFLKLEALMWAQPPMHPSPGTSSRNAGEDLGKSVRAVCSIRAFSLCA